MRKAVSSLEPRAEPRGFLITKKASAKGGLETGADRETRTPDPLITNQ